MDSADLMVIGTRFRDPSPEDAKHVTKFLNEGKPVIGIRTSTHAFKWLNDRSFGGSITFKDFGPKVMGEGWVSHHGKHKVEGARGVIESANADHPILRGVSDVFGPSDVYGINALTAKGHHLTPGAGNREPGPQIQACSVTKIIRCSPLPGSIPMSSPNGSKGTTFCTTMGASVDLVSEDLRRLNCECHLPPERAGCSSQGRCYLRRSLLCILLRVHQKPERILAKNGHATC